MSIVATDILYKFTVKTGAAGNATAGTAAGSLGKYVSTTQITDNTLNNLFDDVSGPENLASTVDYRCVAVHNNHATLTLYSAVVYLSAEVSGGANIAIASDNIAASAIGASAAQAEEISNETTAPTATSAFSSPTTSGTGVALGDIGPGQCKMFWVKRSSANSEALNNDGVTFTVQGRTV